MVAKMRMYNRCVEILNEKGLRMRVLKRVGVAPIEEKMIESRLSGFGHMFGHIVRRTYSEKSTTVGG